MRWVLFAFTAIPAVISWIVGGLSMLCWLAHKPRFEGAAILTLEWREWFASGEDDVGVYDYSTTFIRTIWFQPGARDARGGELDERLERHERVHIRQWEDAMVTSFLVGLGEATACWRLDIGTDEQPLILWAGTYLSGATWMMVQWGTALMRHGIAPPRKMANGKMRSWVGRVFDTAYRDSEIERSAYGQTARKAFLRGESWWDHRDQQREHG